MVRYGIIGLGNQGSYYITKLFDKDKIKNACVSAVCDTDPKKIENLKEKTSNKDIVYFSDYIEMLDSGLCDAVLIEVPHYIHPQISVEALKRNIHVICEKPAGVYAKHVKEMNEAAKKSNALFGLMFNQRTNCVYRKMREMIAAGEIGELQRVTWTITNWFRTQYYYDSGSWRATWDGEGGGVLINQCPHQLDLVQWVVGKIPKYVNGFCQYGKWHDIEVEDEVTAFFEYDNGATGVFITTTGEYPGQNRFEISGTRGRLVCENGKLLFHKNSQDSTSLIKNAQSVDLFEFFETIEVETDGKNEQHAGIINNFTNAILGKEDLFVDGTEGLAGVELMNAIEYSGWLGGKKISLPVNEDDYLRELDKRRAETKEKSVVQNVVSSGIGTFN